MQRILQEIMKKILLGTADDWSMRRSSQRISDPAYYIEDCRILTVTILPALFFAAEFREKDPQFFTRKKRETGPQRHRDCNSVPLMTYATSIRRKYMEKNDYLKT